MNELVLIGNKETMTSLEVAELTNKDHKNILADIRDEISKLGEERGRLIFEPAEYLDKQGKPRIMYNITLNGVLQLGARYDAVIRFNLIQKVNELQKLFEVEDLETLQTLEFKVKKKKSKIKKDKVIENEKDSTEVSRDEETNVIVQQENEIKDNKELV